MTENLRRADQCHRTVADLRYRLSVNRVEAITATAKIHLGHRLAGSGAGRRSAPCGATVDHGAFETPSLPRAERYDPG